MDENYDDDDDDDDEAQARASRRSSRAGVDMVNITELVRTGVPMLTVSTPPLSPPPQQEEQQEDGGLFSGFL